MSKNIVFEGWLTKSPPSKRIWRTKWRRRWFALRQSGELPGQYLLDYYADRNCRRLKGTINLDLCEQVDAGLHMERGNGTLDSKIRGSVFTIQTQSRTYHLEADCEADMEKWVDAICRVCGLRATEDSSNVIGTYQNNLDAVSDHIELADGTGPYIPISECVTGVRAQNSHNFSFDSNDLVKSGNRTPFDRTPNNRTQQMYRSQPHIKLNNAEYSENESNLSEEESRSLTGSQSNIQDWSAAKSFTKLSISSKKNGVSEEDNIHKKYVLGPPPPPRPPKTFALSREQKEAFHGPKIQEPVETNDNYSQRQSAAWLTASRGQVAPTRTFLTPCTRTTDDEEQYSPTLPSMQYYNLRQYNLPPAVDRALKPRHSSHSIGQFHSFSGQNTLHGINDEMKPDVLQYLDLDLHMSKPPPPSKPQELARKKVEIAHGKSYSAIDADSAYKTVDFLKTEAFNITRQDAEASRSNQQ